MKQFTIRFETESVENADSIFESLKTGKIVNGIKVTAISDGDLFKRSNLINKQLDIYIDWYGDELGYEEQEGFDKLEKEIEETFNRDI